MSGLFPVRELWLSKHVLTVIMPNAGVLAVTRSLGDSSMKEFVVGSPYTTETVLSDGDDMLILACDGVCYHTPAIVIQSHCAPSSFGM